MTLITEINFPKLTDEQLKQLTGKTWREWCEELDGRVAKTKTLAFIAGYLMEWHHMRRLWAQMIAVYYKWECIPSKH